MRAPAPSDRGGGLVAALTTPGEATRIALVCAAIATAVRLPLALAFPHVSPDGERYLTIAANIARNFCVSASDPASGVCAPHWGGNHPPLYPAIIAASEWLLGRSSLVFHLSIQILIVAIAVGYGARQIALSYGRPFGMAFGLTAALSILQIPWGRLLLTEALAIASTVWLATEIFCAFAAGRLHIWRTSAAFAAASLIRYDGVLLAAPLLAAALTLHRPREALARFGLISVIAALPLGLWTVRNVQSGLSAMPDTLMTDGSPSPRGYVAWVNAWSTNIYEHAQTIFPIVSQQYDRIAIPPYAYLDEVEKDRVGLLLSRLKDGEPFPSEVDGEFAQLAKARSEAEPFWFYALRPLKRAFVLIFNPAYSFGWPIELGHRGPLDFSSLSKADLGVIAGKAALFLYRVAVLALAVWLIARGERIGRRLLAIAFLYFAARAAFLSIGGFLDNRILVEGWAFLEFAVAMTLVARFKGGSPA